MTVLASAALPPIDLPSIGSPARWPWLQQLRGQRALPLEPWLEAIESGALDPQADLLAALAERFDGPAQRRLLRWWRQQPSPDPAFPAQVVRDRDPATAAWLLDQLVPLPGAPGRACPEAVAVALLPLLGHQRQRLAWSVLQAWLRAPVSGRQRRAALEGVALGLPAWPRAALVGCLSGLATDLDAELASTAVDLLARLSDARRWLLPLAGRALDPQVAQRLQRRLRATPAQPLLLVVHGRSGGELPDALQVLAAELEQRRGAPVRFQLLTAAAPPPADQLLRPGQGLTLVPLLLLPGGHVRHDLPAIVRHWQRHTRVRRFSFLGAWPVWQRALAAELALLPRPLLLHHPLEGEVAPRYCRALERRTGARCLATPYSAEHLAELQLTLTAPALPLALAANRLTDSLADRVGPPLLERPRFHQLLLAELEALP